MTHQRMARTETNSLSEKPSLNIPAAESLLADMHRVLGDLNITFFLRHGTCLGAVRDAAFIPWDDDVDVGSIIGMHGLTPQRVATAVEGLRNTGAEIIYEERKGEIYVGMTRSETRLDWSCYQIQNQTIIQHPGISIPVELFENLKPVSFLGETFLVPNPPERYFELKYGPNWRTPTSAGFERDAVRNVPDPTTWPWHRRIWQRISILLRPGRATRIRVMDAQGNLMKNARVTVVGQSSSLSRTDGIATVKVPMLRAYAVVVAIKGQEEVLYEERLGPGRTYIYRQDPILLDGRTFTIVEETAL